MNTFCLSAKKLAKSWVCFLGSANSWQLNAEEYFMKDFIESQFGYFLLVWMCCNRSCNNYKNYLHERALRLVYNDSVSSFQDLSQRHRSISIHHRNICLFGRERYEVRNNISKHIMSELFEQQNILNNFRSHTDFTIGPIYTDNNSLKSSRYLGPKI